MRVSILVQNNKFWSSPLRLTAPLIILAVVALSACKEDAQSSPALGEFDIMVDGSPTKISSFSGPTNRRSGIMLVNSGGAKILIVEGADGINDDGEPVLPLLSITMISDTSGENFTLDSVQYTLENDGNIYTSDRIAGQQTFENLTLGGGEISFDFSANLVPRAPNSAGRSIVEDVAPIRVEGHFSGVKSIVGLND